MKKGLLYLFILTLGCAVFTSCSDDDDDVSPLVNTWNLASSEENDPVMSVRLENETDSVTFLGNHMSNKDFGNFINLLLGGGYVKDYLYSVTFKADGDLVASIKGTDGQPTTTPTGAVSYKIKGNKVYLIPHLDVMFPDGLPMLTSRATETPSIDLEQILKEGLPVNYKITANKLEAYVTKDMMQPFMTMINEMVQGLEPTGDPSFDNILPMLKMAMTDMVVIVNESSKFEMGLNFNLAAAKPEK